MLSFVRAYSLLLSLISCLNDYSDVQVRKEKEYNGHCQSRSIEAQQGQRRTQENSTHCILRIQMGAVLLMTFLGTKFSGFDRNIRKTVS